MAPFWHYAMMSIKRRTAYREAELAGLVTNAFWCFLKAALLLGVLGSRPSIAGYGRNQMLLYVGLTQALFPCLALFGWSDLMKSVRAGDFISDYCKPVGVYGLWQARDAGRAVYQFLSRGAPMMAFTVLALRVRLPGTWTTWILFGVSLCLAYIISFAWRFTYNAVSFWIVDARGVLNIAYAVTALLTGLMVPVGFFPVWLKTLATLTPFPSMLNTPIEILLKVVSGPGIAVLIGRQAVWAAGMVILGVWVGERGMRRVTVQGG